MHCHLFKQPKIATDDLRFEVIEVYDQSEHFDRKLVRCPACGAMLLHEFKEIVNLTSGVDRMYSTYVSVVDADHARQLSRRENIRDLRPAIFWDPDGSIYALDE